MFLVAAAVFAFWIVMLGAPAASAQTPTPTPRPEQGNECVGCHALSDITITVPGEYRPDLLVSLEDIEASVHSGFVCITCHSTLISTMHDRADVARVSCARCHEPESLEYEAGYHGPSGEGTRPTCITCHGAHQVQDAETREFVHRAAEQCARCHEQMGHRFPSGDVFGMETHLAGAEVATCADCHGYHAVLPVEDPSSPVNEANVLTTCRGCHTNAPANFVEVQMHLGDGPIPEDFRLRLVTIYMLALLIGTFGFFGYLTILGIRHEWRRGARGGAAGH